MIDRDPLPPTAEHYLEQLRHEAAALPAAERSRLVEQIREHLREALADGVEPREAVARLGHPRELVAEAAPEPTAPADGPPWLRVVLVCSMVAAVASGAGVLGMVIAIATGLRGLLLVPSTLLLAAGVSALLAIGVVGLLLQRAGRTRGSEADAALRSHPLLAAGFVAGGTMLALGVLGCALAGLMLLVTANPRSALIGALALAVVVVGVIVLARTACAMRSHGDRTAIG